MPKRSKLGFARPRVDLSEVRARMASPPRRTVQPTSEHADVGYQSLLCETPQVSLPQWAERGDAPRTCFTAGAERWNHNTVLGEGRKRDALQALLKDIHSNASRGPSASLLKTWESMHHAWHGREVPVFPLTPDKILAVASIMQLRGYRSFPNYMSKAKEHHVALSGYWSDSLSLTARKATRSVQRGIGPSRQSEPLRLDLILKLPAEDLGEVEAVAEGGPLFSVTCSSFPRIFFSASLKPASPWPRM